MKQEKHKLDYILDDVNRLKPLIKTGQIDASTLEEQFSLIPDTMMPHIRKIYESGEDIRTLCRYAGLKVDEDQVDRLLELIHSTEKPASKEGGDNSTHASAPSDSQQKI